MKDKVNKASAPKASNDGVYHLQLRPGDVPGYVILPGAPERTVKIAKDWEDVEEVAFYREYKTVRGKYKGMEIACTSTGIGPSSEICLHELNTIECIPVFVLELQGIVRTLTEISSFPRSVKTAHPQPMWNLNILHMPTSMW